jgi:hypothetical protein
MQNWSVAISYGSGGNYSFMLSGISLFMQYSVYNMPAPFYFGMINNTGSIDGYNVSLSGNATSLVNNWNKSFNAVPTGQARQVEIQFKSAMVNQTGNYILFVNISSQNNLSLTWLSIINVTVFRERINDSMMSVLKINATPVFQSVSGMMSPWYNISTIPKNYNITVDVSTYVPNNMSMGNPCEFRLYNDSAIYVDEAFTEIDVNETIMYILPFTAAYNGSYYAVLKNQGATNMINYSINVVN